MRAQAGQLHVRAARSAQYLSVGINSRSSWVFVVYALALFASLALAALDTIWGAAAFIALSAILAVSTVDTGRRMLMKGGSGDSSALLVNQWTSTAAVVVLIVLPWIIGGWAPPTSAFVPSILIALAAGFEGDVRGCFLRIELGDFQSVALRTL